MYIHVCIHIMCVHCVYFQLHFAMEKVVVSDHHGDAFLQVGRKTSRNIGAVLSVSASLDDPTTAAAAKSPSTPSGQVGKKSGARSRQKQSRKGEQRLPAVTEEGAESEEEGGAHLGQPVTVFWHMQRLASQQGQLRSGECVCVCVCGEYKMDG